MKFLIAVKMMGGLGNQLFQYATGRSLSLRLKTDLYLDLYGFRDVKDFLGAAYFLDNFKLAPLLSEMDQSKLRFFKERSTNLFEPEILESPDNIYLCGYWQYEDYFRDQETIIRKELTFKSPLSETSRIWARKILDDPIPVSLHIRRGDYLQGKWASIFHHLQPNYYERCVGFLHENFPEISLYIFSNDIPWCRMNLNFGVPTYFVDANDESHGHEDSCLMSLCRHHIIASSTFSWWGAGLDNRVGSLILSPRKTYQNYDPFIEYRRLPTRWVILDD